MGSDSVIPERSRENAGGFRPVVLTDSVERQAPSAVEESLEALVGRVSAGDRSAFRALYDRTSRLVFGTVLRIVRSREVAEEVAQESYVLLWQRADRFQISRGSALAWIVSIARYRAIDRLRADRARGLDNTCPEDFGDWECQPGDSRVAGLQSSGACCSALSDGDRSIVDAMSIRAALQRLKPDYQRAILLAYRYGYTHEQLACAMDVPLGTAKSWIRRGLRALKDSLES